MNIAYQVVGEAPLDIVLVPGWISHLDVMWESPELARWLRRTASFGRLILFDKRGTGLSDRVTDTATLEERIDDLRAVMDAVGSSRAALLGFFDGGPMCMLFAATYPDRVSHLVLGGTFPSRFWRSHTPFMPEPGFTLTMVDAIAAGNWGQAQMLPFIAPSAWGDEAFRAWWARYERASASPAAAAALQRMFVDIDVTHVLPSIHVPTLVVHRDRDPTCPVEAARYLAEHISGARLVIVPGTDTLPYVGDTESILGPIEEFLTGRRPGASEADRVLATVLFTDIVGSTQRAASIGDTAWRRVLDDHDALAQSHVERSRGRLVKSTGDGLLATFDGPARAIRCAAELRDDLRRNGVTIRAGLHTGEIEVRGDDVAGLAVHIGARVSAIAGAGEVLVSRTVKDLVAGAGFDFEDRGTHELKGIPDDWQVFAVTA